MRSYVTITSGLRGYFAVLIVDDEPTTATEPAALSLPTEAPLTPYPPLHVPVMVS